MTKPELTVEVLLRGGFVEVGCWELNDASDLGHSIDLPKEPGVYAFAIDDAVQYVGLASKSVRQRLNFYRKPGASQRTNVRLNGMIRDQLGQGSIIRILLAHPPDHQWNEFPIKGPEGLEAGLIASFDLPWNMRGTDQPNGPKASKRPADGTSTKSNLSERILDLVKRRPGMTELDIAKAIYGPNAVQPQVNQDCRLLVGKRLMHRRGAGGRADPYVYHPGPGR